MPRYYFHQDDGKTRTDGVGAELLDHAAARNEATRLLRAMMDMDRDRLWSARTFRLTVTDDQALILYVLDLSATIAPAAGPWPV